MSVGPFGTGSFGTGVFSNTPFFNSKTLIDAVLRMTAHSSPTQETQKREVVLDFINNRYATVTTSQHWKWLFQEVDTLFKEPYTAGTVDLTELSQDVVGTGTAFSVNAMPNNVLHLKKRNETYLISTVDSATELTLEGQYAGDTELAAEYEIIKPIYTLPSDCEAIHSIQVDGVGEMVPMGKQEFTRLKQNFPGMTGSPRYYTEIAKRTDNVSLLEVYPAPDKNYTARLMYGVNIIRLSDSDSSIPLIPDRHRQILCYGGLADMYAYLRDPVMSEK